MLPDAAKAIEIITRVLEFYDDGRQWTRASAYREGQRCLISALIWVSGCHDTGYAEDARHYLRAALALLWPGRTVCDVDLIGYNDESSDYEEVRADPQGPCPRASRPARRRDRRGWRGVAYPRLTYILRLPAGK